MFGRHADVEGGREPVVKRLAISLCEEVNLREYISPTRGGEGEERGGGDRRRREEQRGRTMEGRTYVSVWKTSKGAQSSHELSRRTGEGRKGREGNEDAVVLQGDQSFLTSVERVANHSMGGLCLEDVELENKE